MPIVFQPASPMAPGITSGAGAATQYTHDLPSLVSLYESLARNRGGGGGGHAGGGDFQGRSSQPSAPPHFLPPGIAAPPSVGEDRLNQAEQIRIAKLQAGLSWVDSQDSLTDAEKQEYKSMIRAGLDPLLMKQQQVKLRQMQDQAKQLHDQEALKEALFTGNIENRTAAMKRITDVFGRGAQVRLDAKGGMTVVPEKSEELRQRAIEINEAREKRLSEDKRARTQAADKAAFDQLQSEGSQKPTPEQVEERARDIIERWHRIEGRTTPQEAIRRRVIDDNAALVRQDPRNYRQATPNEINDEVARQMQRQGVAPAATVDEEGGQAAPQASAPASSPRTLQQFGSYLLRGNDSSPEEQFDDYLAE